MPMIVRSCAVFAMLSLSITRAGTGKLQDALVALSSKDTSSYNDAVKFITKHSQDAEPALRKMCTDKTEPPLARLRAAKLLGDLKDSGSIDVLKSALFSGEENNAAVREEMVRSLSKLGGNTTVIEYFNSAVGQHAGSRVDPLGPDPGMGHAGDR